MTAEPCIVCGKRLPPRDPSLTGRGSPCCSDKCRARRFIQMVARRSRPGLHSASPRGLRRVRRLAASETAPKEWSGAGDLLRGVQAGARRETERRLFSEGRGEKEGDGLQTPEVGGEGDARLSPAVTRDLTCAGERPALILAQRSVDLVKIPFFDADAVSQGVSLAAFLGLCAYLCSPR